MSNPNIGLLNRTYVIIVLYKQLLTESKTYLSLIQSLDELNQSIKVMVYDNSPESEALSYSNLHKSLEIEYIHDASNPGLVKAYNTALNKAVQLGYEWLLLMDQDTIFTTHYFEEIVNIDSDLNLLNIGAITPRVVSLNGRFKISPSTKMIGGRFKQENIPSGVSSQQVSGINSGTLLNVEYFNSVNSFNPKFTLDMLDHWYFRELFRAGKKVYVLNNKIYHDLSIFDDFETNVSLERYYQLLSAEVEFMKEESFLSKIVFKMRLIRRVLKQLKFKEKKYYLRTLATVFTN